MMDEDYGAKLGEWFEVVRRARFSREVKDAALVVGSYASTDGSGIFCGVARLAVDCGIGYSTARRHLAALRRVGLVELVRRGNRRARKSDEYRLTLPPDLLDRFELAKIELPDPARYKAMIEELRKANQAGQRKRRGCSALTVASAESMDDLGGSALTQGERSTADQRSPTDGSALAQSERPPLIEHLGSNVLTSHDEMDLRTDVAVGRANQDQISSDGLIDATPSAGGSCGKCTKGYRLVDDQLLRCDCAESAA